MCSGESLEPESGHCHALFSKARAAWLARSYSEARAKKDSQKPYTEPRMEKAVTAGHHSWVQAYMALTEKQ